MNIEQYGSQKLKESFFAKKVLRIERMVKDAENRKKSFTGIISVLEAFSQSTEVKTVVASIYRRIRKIDDYIKKISDRLPFAYSRLADDAENIEAQISRMVINNKKFN